MSVQIKVKRKKPKGFQPVTLTITLETIEEVAALWTRTNLSSTVINDAQSCHTKVTALAEGVSCNDLWHELDDLLVGAGVTY